MSNDYLPTGWTPLFGSIINSSIWRESKETRLVWITLLAKKDKTGFVRSSLWALARDAGVTEQECEEAIRVLESPDQHSATKDHEGRRVVPLDGGWQVLNHILWRDRVKKADRLSQQAEWQKEYRRRKKENLLSAQCSGARAAVAEGLADVNLGGDGE